MYRGPCMEPDGAFANGMGAIGLAGSENTTRYLPSSPQGSIPFTAATWVMAETGIDRYAAMYLTSH